MKQVPVNFNYQSQLAEKYNSNPTVKVVKKKWRFKPRSLRPFFFWGLALFIGFKITVLPLCEGIYGYFVNNKELRQLKAEYHAMQKQLDRMKKKRDYMRTPAYVEERAHEIGLVKPEEAQMVVMEGASPGAVIVKPKKKAVEIGD